MPGKPYQDRQWLVEQYQNQFKTIDELADMADAHPRTITRWMDRLEVERRKGGALPWASFYTSKRGYEIWEANDERGSVRVSRLLAVSKYGFDNVCGMEVHHRNKIPWDNRPENITLLTKSKHASVEYNHPYEVKVDSELCQQLREDYERLQNYQAVADKHELARTTARAHILGECINH